jgi:hypothetical protein
MVDYRELRKIINGSNMSVKHYQNGRTVVTDSSRFRGMPLSRLEEAISLVEGCTKEDTEALALKCGTGGVETLDSITRRASRMTGEVMDCLISRKPLSAEEIRNRARSPQGIRDSVLNGRWNVNTQLDPVQSNLSLPNVYISPWQANSLYSQKGLFETIINKKSKSILLNGCNIENPRLSQKQIDTVKERMEVLNFKEMLSESALTSLVYGGALVFPLFRKDTPVTTSLPLSSLLRLGVLRKDCIDYFVSLDRWNTFIIPPYNPTQKDFIRPDVYTVPFLGSDVHHTRCGRVVTAKQAGYWGQVINQGWGISDLCGYLQSGMNYKVAVQSLPLMIQQMSILARVVNVDGVLATEGANALDALVDQDTIRTREASPDNPVTMDVLGDIKSIDRNFGQVPELIRLLRQDLASDAVLPEPLLFSSEKGNFSSGDDTQGNLFKQNESVQMIHKDLECQYKQLAKIVIIDALGTDRDVIEALPYTRIHFDQPVVANALERSQIGKYHSETVFNLVSSRLPIDVAVEMADKNVSSDMRTNADILDKLRSIQVKGDEQEEKRNEVDMEQKKADVEQTKAQIKATEESTRVQKSMTSSPPSSASSGGGRKDSGEDEQNGKSPADEQREKALSDKEEQTYSRLEQKQHEKTRGSSKRSEKLSKFKNKKI